MVGVDASLSPEKLKERDYLCALLSKPNEDLAFQTDDSELPGALADYGPCNGKLAVLSPITPNPCRENGDSVALTDSPLSSESPKSPILVGFSSTESDSSVGSGQDNSPRTPKDGVFDPFAPGPEEICLAPICKKHVKISQKLVARRLDFADDEDDDVDGDDSPIPGEDGRDLETLFEKTVLDSVYETLLKAIVKKQTEDSLAEINSSESESPATPASPPPILTGIAETCPGAPMKGTAGKSRNIDPGLCRKLEF